jgi:hypothetical protein
MLEDASPAVVRRSARHPSRKHGVYHEVVLALSWSRLTEVRKECGDDLVCAESTVVFLYLLLSLPAGTGTLRL